MRRTHLSLYYLAGYLLPAGLLLLLIPDVATKLLFSNRDYDDAPFRLAGIALTALGILIVQIIRLRIEALYATTVLVRLFILAGLAALGIYTADPFFWVIFVVVLIGVVLTTTSLILDRRREAGGS